MNISEEKALAVLLNDGVLFSMGRKYVCVTGDIEPETTVLFVTCNDLFLWGTADAENIAHDEILNLYKFHMDPANKGYGSDKWCCVKRNMKPQLPYQKKMREAGVWDDTMENLPENDPSKLFN